MVVWAVVIDAVNITIKKEYGRNLKLLRYGILILIAILRWTARADASLFSVRRIVKYTEK
ncbi:MAG: hypothetical protein DMG17_33000 [Acidobacteria bacterium]|nr:MAG: hypothetical protein DMG17_33000 [Acidobacteriota bacterium]